MSARTFAPSSIPEYAEPLARIVDEYIREDGYCSSRLLTQRGALESIKLPRSSYTRWHILRGLLGTIARDRGYVTAKIGTHYYLFPDYATFDLHRMRLVKFEVDQKAT
jgi:hypothetical protein